MPLFLRAQGMQFSCASSITAYRTVFFASVAPALKEVKHIPAHPFPNLPQCI
jgi:hypothetical protein